VTAEDSVALRENISVYAKNAYVDIRSSDVVTAILSEYAERVVANVLNLSENADNGHDIVR
jgi:hypothetical protein